MIFLRFCYKLCFMKKKSFFPFFIATGVILFTNCTTTGIAGLAKESYVQQLEAKCTTLENELTILKAKNEEIKDLLGDVKETKSLANDLKRKFETLPRDTLKTLANMIIDYLDQTESRSNKNTPSATSKPSQDN